MKEVLSGKILLYNSETGEHDAVDALRGESAYEAAVRLGMTTLTEEQWLKEYETKRDLAITAIDNKQKTAEDAAQSAINDIETKGKNTLATIPEDYTALSNQVEEHELKISGKAPSYVATVEGVVCKTSTAQDMPLQGLRLFGKTIQDGTPTPENPIPLANTASKGNINVLARGKNLLKNVLQKHTYGGVDITVGADGSLTANGTTSAAYNTPQMYAGIAAPGSYVLSIGAEYNDSCRLVVKIVRSNGEPEYAGVTNELKITLAQGDYIETIYIGVLADAVLTNYTMYPMLRLATEDSVFEPCYDGGSVTVTTLNGLPGVPVTGGGNYTDESGQMWLSDEIDLGRGVYVQRVGVVTFTGTETIIQNTHANGVYFEIHNTTIAYGSYLPLCTRLPAVNGDLLWATDADGISASTTSGQLRVRFTTLGVDSEGALKAKLAEWYAAGVPMTAYVVLASPVETPLSADELAAYRAMYTINRDTFVLNDAGAWMEVGYADDVCPVRYDAPQILSDVQKAQALENIGASPVVVETLEGEIVTTDIASYMPLQGLRLFGKTTQDGTPSPDNPVPLVNVGAGGSISVLARGKNLFNYEAWKGCGVQSGSAIYENNGVTLTATNNDCYTYYWQPDYPESANIKVMENDVVALSWEETTNKEGYVYIFPNGKADGARGVNNANVKSITYVVPAGVTFIVMRFGVRNAGDTIAYKNIQIECGSAATAYEPYKDGGSVTISAPNGLPGIPVTTGGNYTDTSGQQWISDEIDLERGVYVQRVKEYRPSVYDLSSVNSATQYRFHSKVAEPLLPMYGLCNIATSSNTVWGTSEGFSTNELNGEGAIYINLPNAFTSVEDINAYTAENPIIVLAALITPIETPLSADELAAYRTMRSTKPNTTVYNDVGAWQQVDCAADTKLYIDKKFNELQAAILSQGANV